MRKLLIGLVLGLIVIAALLWWSAPTIVSYFQNSASSDNSYTSLTLRDKMNNTATLEFGDTEYSFAYYYGLGFSFSTFINNSGPYTAKIGDTYRDIGIEVKVKNITTDYISNYIVILVKPTVQNYMASLHYTLVNTTLNQVTWVYISSGLVSDEATHKYGFMYTKVVHPTMYEPQLTIYADTQQKIYYVYASGSYMWSTNIKDFNIETTVFKTESQYMLIYVKPLY
jgi:hypothetical protein